MLECKHDENIILSFKYSVNSKEYTIEKVTKKTKEKCNDIMYELYEKFKELSNLKLVDFQNKPKTVGYEMLPLYELNVAIDESSTVVKAARDALNGWDPTGGAIYYFNPNTATNKWIWSRPYIKTIGKHRFCK